MRKSITAATLAHGLSGWGAAAYAAGPTTFNYTGNLAMFTVPVTGTYSIVALGAMGGAATISQLTGGNGAEVIGDFNLPAGDTLDIVVGMQGNGGGNAGFGGGGTFVYDATLKQILEAAGGGGGAGTSSVGDSGQAGLSGDAGNAFMSPNTQGAGGTGGNGGGAGNDNGNSGGGGGGGYAANGSSSFTGTGGIGFLPYLSNGGDIFDGGSHGGSAGGGGSGYSGGGGGGNNGAGGGGGSFNGGLSDANFKALSGVQSGNGQVVINQITSSASAPEPGALALLGGIGPAVFSFARRMRARR